MNNLSFPIFMNVNNPTVGNPCFPVLFKSNYNEIIIIIICNPTSTNKLAFNYEILNQGLCYISLCSISSTFVVNGGAKILSMSYLIRVIELQFKH